MPRRPRARPSSTGPIRYSAVSYLVELDAGEALAVGTDPIDRTLPVARRVWHQCNGGDSTSIDR